MIPAEKNASRKQRPALREASHAAIGWTAEGMHFRLESDDRRVLEMAATVFREVVPVSRLDFKASVRGKAWRIDRHNSSHDQVAAEEWTVSEGSPGAYHSISSHRSRDDAVKTVEYEALRHIVDNCEPTVAALHSALACRDEKGVVIVGPSCAGKSTLAAGLWSAGWTLMSDDVAFVSADGTASPAPRRVSLRNGSRELVGEDLWKRISAAPSCIETDKGLFFHPDEATSIKSSSPIRVHAFLFLARLGVVAAPAVAERMNRATAAVALLPYAMNVRRLPFPLALRALAPLAESIPAYDMGRGELPAMVAAVSRLLA